MRLTSVASAIGACVVLVIACGGDDSNNSVPPDGGTSGSPDHAGQSCTAAAQCYRTLDAGTIHGQVQCLDRVQGGYCTHLCETDADCCAVPGECLTDYPQVCAPYENQPDMRCFLSCEDDLLDGLSGDDYCDRYAYPGFTCHSTGGGSANRKICGP